MQDVRDGDGDVALGDDQPDFGIAGLDGGAVQPMDPSIAIARLSAALFANRLWCLAFSHSSFPMNSHPLPPGCPHCFKRR
jgi:hypothetical protein